MSGEDRGRALREEGPLVQNIECEVLGTSWRGWLPGGQVGVQERNRGWRVYLGPNFILCLPVSLRYFRRKVFSVFKEAEACQHIGSS